MDNCTWPATGQRVSAPWVQRPFVHKDTGLQSYLLAKNCNRTTVKKRTAGGNIWERKRTKGKTEISHIET